MSLLDPESCGEDPHYNAARVFALAPQYCTDCADFHVRSVAHRCAVPPRIIHDRPQLITLLRSLIDTVASRRPATVDIFIPGSADTAMLATAAHAAATLGENILARCRFIVLDRCATPLIICQEFAARHRLLFEARREDMHAAISVAADLILLHSTFRFIDHAEQAAMLDKLGGWLKPEGRIIFSNRILLRDRGAEVASEIRRRIAKNETVAKALAEGNLGKAVQAESIMGHLARAMTDWEGLPGEFYSLEEVRALFRRTQLHELMVEELCWDIVDGPGDVTPRKRILAVLARDRQGWRRFDCE